MDQQSVNSTPVDVVDKAHFIRAVDERRMLGNAIANVAFELGIFSGDVALEPSQLLLLCDDIIAANRQQKLNEANDKGRIEGLETLLGSIHEDADRAVELGDHMNALKALDCISKSADGAKKQAIPDLNLHLDDSRKGLIASLSDCKTHEKLLTSLSAVGTSTVGAGLDGKTLLDDQRLKIHAWNMSAERLVNQLASKIDGADEIASLRIALAQTASREACLLHFYIDLVQKSKAVSQRLNKLEWSLVDLIRIECESTVEQVVESLKAERDRWKLSLDEQKHNAHYVKGLQLCLAGWSIVKQAENTVCLSRYGVSYRFSLMGSPVESASAEFLFDLLNTDHYPLEANEA